MRSVQPILPWRPGASRSSVRVPHRGAQLAVVPGPGGGLDDRALIRVHVLLVDDDRDICELLQFVLEGQGALVTVAQSAAEALRALELAMPDVLVSDVSMPGTDGYDLMREIVARKGDAAPPALSLTGYAGSRDRRQAQEAGYRLQIAKPTDSGSGAFIRAVAALAKTTRADGSLRPPPAAPVR